MFRADPSLTYVRESRHYLGIQSSNELVHAEKFDHHGKMALRWRRPDLIVGLMGICFLLGSLFCPWIASRGPTRTYAPSVFSLTIIPWILAILFILCLFGVLHSAHSATLQAHPISLTAATVMAILPVATVISLNVVSYWLSPAFIPSTWRRVLIGVSPSSGVWLALVGGALVVICVAGGSTRFLQLLSGIGRGLRNFDRSSIAFVLTVFGLILYLASRYQPWVSFTVDLSSSRVENWEIPGYAIPVAGISSLIEISLLVVCLVWLALAASRFIGVLLVTIGWAPITYGVVFTTSNLIPSKFTFSLPSFVLHSLSQWSPKADRLSNGYVQLPKIPRQASFSILHSSGGFEVLIAGMLITLAGLLILSSHKEISVNEFSL